MSIENQKDAGINVILATALFDDSSKCIHANAQFCQLLGYTSTEFYAMDLETLIHLVHPEDRVPTQERVKAFDAPQLVSLKERQRFIKKDGTIVLVDKTMAISRDIDGNQIVVAVTLEEVL
jgi:PAS domain S-box-containing protein